MAQLGYNLMRIHHIDCPWVNIFRDNGRRDTRHLSPKAFDSLDWWIKCLKDEGIYVWLDMNNLRTLTPGDGVTAGFDEIQRNHGHVAGFSYFNPDVVALMREFQHQYLNHLNPYTRLAYRDDPAVVGILITNENDLTHHFGNFMLPDKKHPVHNALWTRGYQSFAQRFGLPPNRVFQTWLPGPSKLYLGEVEHQFNQMMIADLRTLGVRTPIATTNFWGDESLYSLPPLADGDVIDVHSYGESEAMSANAHYQGNYMSRIGAAQVYGKPLTITEWNVPYPNLDRFTAPLYMASIASLQGWNMPMIYNYSQAALSAPGKSEWESRIDRWSTYYDPALSAVMPAAAVAFRQGHIAPARTTYCLMLSPDQLFDRALNPGTSATIRTLTERSRLTIGLPAVKELPWLRATQPNSDVKLVTDPDRDFIPEAESSVRSDTGELTRDWELGIQTIDTPRTQAVSGWIGAKTLATRDATFHFDTKKAVVALTSIDNQPLKTSRFILITAVARAIPSVTNHLPFLSEPVTGALSVRVQTGGLELLALGCDGRIVGRHTPERDHDLLTLQLPALGGTHWYVLKAGEPSNGKQAESQTVERVNKSSEGAVFPLSRSCRRDCYRR